MVFTHHPPPPTPMLYKDWYVMNFSGWDVFGIAYITMINTPPLYNVRVSGNWGTEDEYQIEKGAGGSGRGMVCKYWHIWIGDNMVTLAFDNIKWICGPWLKYRLEEEFLFQVSEKITGRKLQQKWMVPQ